MKIAASNLCLRLGFAFTALVGACGQEAVVPDDILAGDPAFAAVPRLSGSDVEEVRSALSSGSSSAAATLGVQPGDSNFYLAIRKDLLAERWFLSAYLKQAAERAFDVIAPWGTLGTRVVSFKRQNDKLFMFDVSDQRMASEVIDPPNLLEAYPIVERPEFDRLRGAEKYVLIDPSAGLNRFGVTSEIFKDWGFASLDTKPDTGLRVGLAFMQNFRSLPDGISYEQVFTGDYAGSDELYTLWGLLGLTLRRYSVGEGYSATPHPGIPHYFTTEYRALPDSGGYARSTPVKWNVRPGMKPVKVFIGAGATRAQAAFPDVDVRGAFERGVEGWNDVFGFPVFEAVFVNDDAVRDDDASFILVDYPGAGYPWSFADFRANPINGEIRGASVYFSGVWFDDFPYIAADPPAGSVPSGEPNAGLAGIARMPAPAATPLSLTWAGMPGHRPACAYLAGSAERLDPAALVPPYAGPPRTADQKRSLRIQSVVTHEIGHALGLRHNFAGSLEPPSSSVMDYLRQELHTQVAAPGPYDRDAVRYLYGMTSELPGHPFCTDDHVSLTPLCQRHDQGADPLFDHHVPNYQFFAGLLLDGTYPASVLEPVVDWYVNTILMWARDTGTVDRSLHAAAIALAFDRTAVPMSAADAASPPVVARANALADMVLRRIALDDSSLRGSLTEDVTDPDAIAQVALQAGRMLRNEDGIRTLALRRTAVDVLERLQADAAFLELRASRDALEAAIGSGQTGPSDVPFLEDLLTRIDVALTPYFD